jgi:YVTN family beta-propeller protein
MKSDAQRTDNYTTKTAAANVAAIVAATLPAQRTNFADANGMSDLVAKEQQTQGLLNASAIPIPTIHYPFYYDFIREIWAKVRKGISGPALALAAQGIFDKWNLKGFLWKQVLIELADTVESIWIPQPPIPVGIGPSAILLNPSNGKIYTADTDGNTVTAIDCATNTVIGSIPTGNLPNALCLNTTNNKIYASNEDDNTVTVIDSTTDTVVATVNVGTTPYHLCYNATNNKIYCANTASANVTIIDGATNAVLATVATGTTPNGGGRFQ